MASFIVVDNRQFPVRDFLTEASYASYHRNASSLVGKYCAYSGVYSWFPFPESLAIALSPDKVRLVHKSQWNVSQVATLLEPKYSCVGGSTIPKTTWSAFFNDALQKCVNGASKYLAGNQRISVILVSTDMCLLGDHNSTGLDEALDRFCCACLSLHQAHPGLIIRIICTIVSDLSGYKHYENANMMKVMQKLKAVEAFVSFQSVVNSQLHFEEELRCIVSSFSQPLFSKIEFPMHGGANCSLVLQLCASTGTAANVMHSGLKTPELCGLISRSGIDPCYLDGKGFKVSYPSSNQALELLPSKESRHQNMLTFRSLAHYMAMRDVLLLLRAPFLHASSSGVADYKIESDQYWALIPPPLPQLGEASTSALADPRMVLVKLVDRDDILADTSAVVQAPSHAAASSSGGIGDSECGGGQGVSAEDDGVAADAEIQEDIEQYLEDSLHASLGNPDLFNPMIYTSNTINNLYEQHCRQPLSKTSNSSTSGATPPACTYAPLSALPAPTRVTPPTVPKPKGSLALTTKPTTVFTSQAFPDSTSSTSAAAKRQSAGSKKRHINPSYFTADGVDIDGGTSNHAPSGNSSSGSRRTVIDLSVDAASTQQDQQAPKRGPGRPSGTSKRTAKATTSAGGGGTKNYTLSDARSSGGVDDSINGGGGVKAGTYSHTKSTNGVEQESMWDLDLDLQLDDIPARPAPHRGGAPAQTIPPAGAQSSQQLWSSHLDLDQQAATNIAVDDRSNSLRHSRAFTEVSSDAHLVPAPSSFAAYSAYGTAAASVSALAPASAPAEPVPPRFLKRKFSGAPLTSLPAWEDDER